MPKSDSNKSIRIGTRATKLAIRQAEILSQEIINKKIAKIDNIEIIPIKSSGDYVSASIGPYDGKLLFTKEIEYLKTKKIKSIEFKWKKNGPFNDDLINDLLYHDIYILLYLFGLRNIYKVFIHTNINNKLNFKFNYNDIKVKVNYDRLFKKQKFKSINFDGEELIFNRNNNDPLKDLIKKCINNKLDFKSNNKLNIQTVKLINKLRIHLT